MAKKSNPKPGLVKAESQTLENERPESTDVALSVKQEKALAALLMGKSNREAGRAAGVAESTLRRWRKEPAFLAAYRESRAFLVSDAIARAQLLHREAVETMGELMRDKEQPGAVRATASKFLHDTSVKGVEIEDHAARIEALEAKERERESEGQQ